MKFLLILLISVLLGGCQIKPQKTEIEIITRPVAKIYINDQYVGDTSTRYQNTNLGPGEISLKLVPEDKNLKEWSYRLKLNNLTTTVVDRKFESDEKYSSGYVMYMERIGDKDEPAVVINSKPADASIKVDGVIRGRSPTKLERITEGDRRLVISYPGYESQNLFIKARNGYQIVVDIQLSATKIEIPDAEEEPAITMETKKVVVKETGTGWLRVRDVPSLQGREVAKVNTGQKYKLIDGSQDGWYQIEIDESTTGWVSSDYSEIIEE